MNEQEVLQFEDLFEEELKMKDIKERPKEIKSKYGLSILYYIFIMFIVAGFIQLFFLSNENNIHNYTAEEYVILNLYNDTSGIALMDSDVYETFEDTYGSYIEKASFALGDYAILYHASNPYILNGDVTFTNTLFDQISTGTLLYWDDTDTDSLITIYINEDQTLVNQIINNNIYTVSLYGFMIEDIAADIDGMGLIEKTAYDTYYAFNSDQVATYNYSTDYYLLYNKDNTDIASMTFQTLQDILIGTSSADDYNVYSVKDQMTPYQEYLNRDATHTDYGSELTGFASGLVNFLIYLILGPVLLIILKPNLSYDFEMIKTQNRSKLIQGIVVGYVFLILGNYVSSIVSTGLSWLFDQPITEAVNQMTIESTLNSSGAIFMILSAVIIGPVVEELIFRKSIFGLISNKWIALVTSSVVFGAIHLIGEASLVDALINGSSYIIMGFVFGYIYIKNDKNIIYPTLVHILSNLISILAILFLF